VGRLTRQISEFEFEDALGTLEELRSLISRRDT